MTRTVDFDLFRSEQKAEPFELKIGGHTYEMPAALPASLALDIVRLHESSDEKEDVKPEDLMRVGAGLFGGEAEFRRVLDEGKVSLDELPDLIKMVVEAYTGGEGPNPTAQA